MSHQQDRMQALRQAGLATFVEVVKAIPVVGDFVAAGVAGVSTYLDEIEKSRDLPEHASIALRQLAADYERLLEDESKDHAQDNTLALALPATLQILIRHGLSAAELVDEAALDASQAAQLTLKRAQDEIVALFDTDARELA